MPGIEDWVNCPLNVIQNMFDQHGAVNSATVKDYFNQKLLSGNALSWVPSLNDTPLHNLRPNSLIRYRCMIQDMFDPEFYLGCYEVTDRETRQSCMKSGKFKDIATCGNQQEVDLDSNKNVTMDRHTLYCVPIPGETQWVKQTYAELSSTKSKAKQSTSYVPVRTKRSLDEGDGTSVDQTMESSVDGTSTCRNPGPAVTDLENKRNRTDTPEAGTSAQSDPDLNFPLPGESGPACLVKIYNEDGIFKVNDVVEFIGVLSVDPALAEFHEKNGSGEENMMTEFEVPMEERNAHAPPPSLVPRLHAVLSHKLSHINPHLPREKDSEEYLHAFTMLQSELDTVRTQLLSVLEHAMFGDKLAAELMLCHLLSSVYARADVMPLGKFCLNITKCPQTMEYSQLIHKLVAALTTKSHLLPLSIENMNQMKLTPQKDYTANRLKSGILQLSAGTNLVVDEAALQPGQLDTNGVRNITSLGNMITWQKVQYDFSYHQQEFLADVSVLTLSEGKSLLPSDCLLPLEPKHSPASLPEHFSQLDARLTSELLTKCRLYISLARPLNYNMSEEMQSFIQDDFVEIRKLNAEKMTVDDFHSLLCLVRLLSISCLQSSPTKALWQKAKSMEVQRKQRIAQVAARNQTNS